MHHDLKAVRATLHAAHTLNAFVDWLRAEGSRLLDSVELLGGESWKIHADSVLAAVEGGTQVIELKKELSDLFRLLSLEFTDNLDSDEAALFIVVHPDDPRADDARCCMEALERGINAIEQLTAADGKSQEAA